MNNISPSSSNGRKYTSSREVHGIMAALASGIIMGLISPVTMNRPLSPAPPQLMAFLTVFIAFLCLIPFALRLYFKKPCKPDIVKNLTAGAIVHGMVPLLYSLTMFSVSASQTAMAFSTVPIWVLLLVIATGREVLSMTKLIGVLVSTLGLSVVILDKAIEAPGLGSSYGLLGMMGSAFFQAIYITLAPPAIRRTHYVVFTTCALGAGSVVLFAFCLLTGTLAPVADITKSQWFYMLLNSIFTHCIPYCLFNYALIRTTPVRVAAAIITYGLVAPLYGVIFERDFLDWTDFLGLVIAIVGIWITFTGSFNRVLLPGEKGSKR